VTTQTTPQLVDALVIQKMTGIPRDSIYELAQEGKIPAHRFGNRWRFDPEAVLEATRCKPDNVVPLPGR
jgi:excisionase family DNA binding protein